MLRRTPNYFYFEVFQLRLQMTSIFIFQEILYDKNRFFGVQHFVWRRDEEIRGVYTQLPEVLRRLPIKGCFLFFSATLFQKLKPYLQVDIDSEYGKISKLLTWSLQKVNSSKK